MISQSNVNKLLSHASKIRSTAFLLEGFEVIEALSQVLDLLISLAPLSVDLLPDSIDIANFICEEEIITESLHEMVNLDIAPLSEDLDPVLDLILFLREVIVKLVYELLALLETSNVTLSPAIPLGLDHGGSWQRGHHLHLEPCSFDLCFVHFRSLFLNCKDGLSFFEF